MISKSDSLILGLAIVAVGLAFTAYLRTKEKQPRTHSEIKQELQLVGIIRETDCVDCIEKVLCQWNLLEQEFQEQNLEVRLIFAIENRKRFDVDDLRILCEPPISFELVELTALKSSTILPLSTPGLMVTNGQQILHLEPFFSHSDFFAIRQRLSAAVAGFLPRAF